MRVPGGSGAPGAPRRFPSSCRCPRPPTPTPVAVPGRSPTCAIEAGGDGVQEGVLRSQQPLHHRHGPAGPPARGCAYGTGHRRRRPGAPPRVRPQRRRLIPARLGPARSSPPRGSRSAPPAPPRALRAAGTGRGFGTGRHRQHREPLGRALLGPGRYREPMHRDLLGTGNRCTGTFSVPAHSAPGDTGPCSVPGPGAPGPARSRLFGRGRIRPPPPWHRSSGTGPAAGRQPRSCHCPLESPGAAAPWRPPRGGEPSGDSPQPEPSPGHCWGWGSWERAGTPGTHPAACPRQRCAPGPLPRDKAEPGNLRLPFIGKGRRCLRRPEQAWPGPQGGI